MATINPNNNLQFKSASHLMSSIKMDMESYDSMGLINNQKLYKHIKYLLERLGLSMYKEYDCITQIDNYTGKLPTNFSKLHAAFKVSSNVTNSSTEFSVPLGKFTYYIQETCSSIDQPCNMQAPPVITKQSKIEYKTVVKGTPQTHSFNNATLMTLAPNTASYLFEDKCINIGNGSDYEFSLDLDVNKVYTNFKSDHIFLQYYGLPIDQDTGLPQIPSESVYYKAFEDYLKFKIFEDLWINSDMPDIERKYQKAEINYNESMREALHLVKLPSFQSSVDVIKNNRNRFSVYQIS